MEPNEHNSQIRTRMLQLNANYQYKYPDGIYNTCQQKDETQKHVLQHCRKRETPNKTLVEIFNKGIPTFRKAVKIQN